MLNWLARYAPAGAMLLEDGRPTGSILDVGCGPHGLACAHPQVPFVGLDVAFPHPVAPSMVGIEAPAGALPFVDGAFDTVVSLDTLEHVPRADRATFVAELARVSARRVLLACPSDEGAPLDTLVRERFAAAGVPVPSWLSEHEEHVLPSRAEIESLARAVPGFRARPWPMVNGLLAALLPWADLFEFSRQSAVEASARRADWVRLLERADFGPSFRCGWVLERLQRRLPVVSLDDMERDVARALRCLACGAPYAWVDGAPACTSCGHLAERAPSNAWRLATAPRNADPPATTPHPTERTAAPGAAPPAPRRALLLRPDWGRPETWLPPLSAYLASADQADDVTLFVDAGEDLDLAAELMATACRHLAGDAPFADVAIIAPGDGAPSGAELTSDAATMRTALGAHAHDVAGWTAEEIVRHARWGKVLADGLRALVDLHRFDAAPAPWEDPEPLVSVIVAAAELDRALPSVLGGSYANVEVLVCGAASEPFADPRVRAVGAGLNAALESARGAWIAPLTEGDVFTHDHIATLLSAARHRQLDLVWGDAICHVPDRPPLVVGDPRLQPHGICHGAVLYSARVATLGYDEHSLLDGEASDWNLWRRIAELGAAIGHVPRTVLLRTPPAGTAANAMRELPASGAAWYLDVAPIRVPAAA